MSTSKSSGSENARKRRHENGDVKEKGQQELDSGGKGESRSRSDNTAELGRTKKSRHENRDRGEIQRREGRDRDDRNDCHRRRSDDHRREERRLRDREGERDDEEEEEEEDRREGKPSWENSRVRRHAEMLRERKLLWKGGIKAQQGREEADKHKDHSTAASSSAAGSEKKLEDKWQSMIAASAKDTQQMDKFQRLMGMKKSTAAPKEGEEEKIVGNHQSKEYGPSPLTSEDPKSLERERLRQLELQRGLDRQFEMARQTHHTARGRGLGSI